MVCSQVVTLAVAALWPALAAASAERGQAQPAQTVPAAARPFEALLPRLLATAPGTYVVDKTTLVAAPDGERIPVLLQADVLRGPERTTRVGIVVGASVTQAVEVRLRVLPVSMGREGAHAVADAGGTAAPGPVRLVREFSLSPGDYDVEAIVGAPRPGGGVIASLSRSRLTIPDIQGGALALTPIVAGQAATSPREASVPFVFGRTTLTPAVQARFPQDGAISVAFRIYNWTAKAEEKPDLTVEYAFYEQGTKGLHFFNKVKPQQLNGDTLGTAFDPSAGSVAAGMMIPLQAFTFGDFQLVVKVTDNRDKKSTEREMRFTVGP
jgi:hypothetical protein